MMNIKLFSKHLLIYITLIILALLLPLNAVACRETTSIVFAHPVFNAKTVEQLIVNSDIVVIGLFGSQERIVQDSTNKKNNYYGWRELSFSVSDILKGSPKSQIWVAQHVVFKQNGSIQGPFEEDTLLLPGQQFVLFLNLETVEDLPHAGDFYWLSGAIQGAFPIIGDKVYSRNITGEIPEGYGPTVNGIPLEQFTAELKQLVKQGM